ncbi:hypothetical protein RchiOBHm_Chr4g0409831 [Rosa chinensis]|uniref:Uncharacterized protein n=1 Tax=Rosa chinensis TaxID=74649 RepID=A0A2P6QV75_ROSCH|nr:hypothetical protein RchiOBHm_Chr4g0409831 [Rosa chinensis]
MRVLNWLSVLAEMVVPKVWRIAVVISLGIHNGASGITCDTEYDSSYKLRSLED